MSDKKTVTIKIREAKWIVSHLEERKKTFKENTAGWIKVDKLIAIVEEAMKKSLWEESERIEGVMGECDWCQKKKGEIVSLTEFDGFSMMRTLCEECHKKCEKSAEEKGKKLKVLE